MARVLFKTTGGWTVCEECYITLHEDGTITGAHCYNLYPGVTDWYKIYTISPTQSVWNELLPFADFEFDV
jgi:hypothetical protein